jgi:hypothetical protein
MARYAGKKGAVYNSTTLAGATAAAVGLSQWTLNMATDKVNVTAFGDGNKVYVQGLKDVQGTLRGFWNDDNDALFDASESTDGVMLLLYPSTDAATKYFRGPAWLDMSIEVDVSGAVAINGSYVAAGTWERF